MESVHFCGRGPFFGGHNPRPQDPRRVVARPEGHTARPAHGRFDLLRGKYIGRAISERIDHDARTGRDRAARQRVWRVGGTKRKTRAIVRAIEAHRKERTCPECGASFVRESDKHNRTCSDACARSSTIASLCDVVADEEAIRAGRLSDRRGLSLRPSPATIAQRFGITDGYVTKLARGRGAPIPPRLKENCPAGHSLSGENVRIAKGGYRICRLCQREHSRRFDEKRRLERSRRSQ